jgi:hypothetical protein
MPKVMQQQQQQVCKKVLKRDLSTESEDEWDPKPQICPKRVRVICTDPDATDSSSDEEGNFRRSDLMRNSHHRRHVQEINIQAQGGGGGGASSSSDSEDDDVEVPSYHSTGHEMLTQLCQSDRDCKCSFTVEQNLQQEFFRIQQKGLVDREEESQTGIEEA